MSETRPNRVGALIVDDQDDVRFLIRTVIESSDEGVFVAAEAASGEQALEVLRAGGPQVALVDVVIPPGDDLEVARLVRQRHPDVPVVLWSADVDSELRASAAELGISACVDKSRVEEIPAKLRAVAEASGQVTSRG